MNTSGKSLPVQKTAMAEHCGGSERCSAEQKTPDCGERLAGYSNTLFPLLQNFEVLVRALSHCLDLKSTSRLCQETALRSELQMRWQNGCSIHIWPTVRRNGNGSRMCWRTRTLACRNRCYGPENDVRMRR